MIHDGLFVYFVICIFTKHHDLKSYKIIYTVLKEIAVLDKHLTTSLCSPVNSQ